MATNTTQAAAFRMGKLKRSDFKTPQEFADAIAESLIGTFEAGDKGKPGEKGSDAPASSLKTKQIDVPNGATSVDAGFDVEDSNVKLVNELDATPTMGISAINGQIVNFTIAAPTDNYKVRIIYSDAS